MSAVSDNVPTPPAPTAPDTAPLTPDPPDDRTTSLALLDTLQSTWLEKAQDGDPTAALIVLSILKHRAALLGLTPRPSPALRVAATSSPVSADATGTPGEVKLVVEYVNDWREVLRRRT